LYPTFGRANFAAAMGSVNTTVDRKNLAYHQRGWNKLLSC
jgi:hypothetical protein